MWYNIHRNIFDCKQCGKHTSTLNQNPYCAGCGKIICNECNVKELCSDCFDSLTASVHNSLIKKRFTMRMIYTIAIIFIFFWGSHTNNITFHVVGIFIILFWIFNLIYRVKGFNRLFAKQAYMNNIEVKKKNYRKEIMAEQKSDISSEDIEKMLKKHGRHKTVDILTEREIEIAAINGQTLGSFDARIRANEVIDKALNEEKTAKLNS